MVSDVDWEYRGFGRVFAAKDVINKGRVAIKRVPHITDKDKKNNYCEIGFLSKCIHPNIVQFKAAHEVKGEAWLVTEFLEGGTLSEAVKVHQFSGTSCLGSGVRERD